MPVCIGGCRYESFSAKYPIRGNLLKAAGEKPTLPAALAGPSDVSKPSGGAVASAHAAKAVGKAGKTEKSGQSAEAAEAAE